jgi:2-polyprenyl-3-methyl-5-hydroxy-6-metoxy-1,4-benzoquinol methylase
MGTVTKNKYGFYELKNKPSAEELKTYYSEKYYQENNATYEKIYSDEEIKYFFNKIEQKYFLIENNFRDVKRPELLDIGCGEGFALKFFKDKGWGITGLDYSTFGCRIHNPEFADNIITGDIFENLEKLKKSEKKFEVIWLDNVLEHVPDSVKLIKTCYEIGKENSVLIIEVPNDFSKLQELALNKGYIEEEFWVVSPDHVSYFNKEGLINLCMDSGWKEMVTIGDFPIEINLLNDFSNYIKDGTKGKSSHNQRVAFENLLHEISVEKTNKFYEALANLGLGRQIIGIFTK